MTATIRKVTFDEIETHPDFPALLREYADECAIQGLPQPQEKLATYRQLSQSPFFTIFAAFVATALVGFLAVLTPEIPHYGIAIAVAESFFVAKAFRHSGAGLRLLHAVEAYGREKKVPGLLVSAPTGGRLAEVLPRVGYRETNRVFFRELTNE